MLKRLLLTLLLCMALPVQAITTTWDAPTQYTDGSTLPVFDIDHYTFYFGNASRAYTQWLDVAGTSYTYASPPAGISALHYVTVTVTTKNGKTSLYANEKVVQPLTPGSSTLACDVVVPPPPPAKVCTVAPWPNTTQRSRYKLVEPWDVTMTMVVLPGTDGKIAVGQPCEARLVTMVKTNEYHPVAGGMAHCICK